MLRPPLQTPQAVQPAAPLAAKPLYIDWHHEAGNNVILDLPKWELHILSMTTTA